MDLEEELRANGFSEKELKLLKNVLSNELSKGETVHSLLVDLSKRFWGGVVCILVLLITALSGFLTAHEPIDVVAYTVVVAFIAWVVYFIIPMKLAWKARKYLASKHEQ